MLGRLKADKLLHQVNPWLNEDVSSPGSIHCVTVLLVWLLVVLFSHSQYSFSIRSTRLSTCCTRLSTRSTRLSIRLSTRSTRLSLCSICLSTCSARSTIYKAESTSKIELLLRRAESRVAESVIVSSNHTLLNGIKTRAA